MKKITNVFSPLTLLLVFFTHQIYSQTGPGGVGNSSTNVLWLKANDLGLADGADIATWTDSSGNLNHLSQPNASFRPSFETSELNGLPIVRFNVNKVADNERLRRNTFAGFPTTEITAIYVNKSASDSGDGVLSYSVSNADNNHFLIFDSSNYRLYRSSSNFQPGVSAGTSWNIMNVSWKSDGGDTEFWKNGSKLATGNISDGSPIVAGGTLSLAGEQDLVDGGYTASQAHSGDFGEVIMYNTYLNEAEQIIVSNYLASKYQLTISNDFYLFEASHSHDVSGIGRQNVSNTHLSSMSANVLQVENASALDDGDYLFFGHDNSSINSWTTIEAPNSGVDIQRLSREWRFDETSGDVGNVDFIIETNNFPALPASHTTYVLLVDSDGDFSSGTSIHEMILDSGTRYKASGIDISDGDYVAIGVINPKVQFSSTTGFGVEDANATFSVELNFLPAITKTVNFNTSSGTAISGTDFTTTNTTISFLPGSITQTQTVPVIDDGISEVNENFTATLSSPSAGLNLGVDTVNTYTINDNDSSRKVFFVSSSSSGVENITPVNVALSLSEPALNSSVSYTVSGSASGSGVDYTLASGVINFTDGSTSDSINIVVNDDLLSEVNETIIITLYNPINCNLGSGGGQPIIFTYTIIDNDVIPVAQFNTSSSSGNESITSVNVQVDLSNTSATDSFVDFTISGSASSGVDYTLSSGTLTISSGSSFSNIVASIVDDSQTESSETIIITLSNPVNCSLGVNTVHTYTIIDNDTFGNSGPGGVGDVSSNVLWLKAESLSLADGANVLSWGDSSGNGNSLTQPTSGFAPNFIDNNLNGFPIVRFNATNNDRIRRTGFATFPTNEITTIYVNKVANTANTDAILSYATSPSNSNEFLLFDSSSLRFYRNSSVNTSQAFSDNNWHINSLDWNSSTGSYKLWKDGSNVNSGTISKNIPILSGGSFAIGGEQDGIDSGYDTNQAYDGDFAEVMVFNVALNKVQKILISNYLSGKYNIPLSGSNFFLHRATFGNDLIGIGQADDGSIHIDSKNDILRFHNPSSIGNDRFLFAGRNNKTPKASLTFGTNTSGNFRERLGTKWRVSKRNNLGAIDIDFDLTGIDLSGKQSCADLELVISASESIIGSVTKYVLSNISGAIYRATGVSFANNDYFTIEYTDKVASDGVSFFNGQGPGNSPSENDDCFKLLVRGNTTISADADVRAIEIESGARLSVANGESIEITEDFARLGETRLSLNGEMRLVGNAQLIRAEGTTNSVSGTGKLFRDQEGIYTTVFQSGHWSSPVTTNGSTYTIAGVLKDGTTATTATGSANEAQDIVFTDSNDGSKTNPITISRRWLAKLVNATDWTRNIDENSILNPGEGFNMKPPGGGSAQRFTFEGIPNDGTYTSTIDDGRLSLVGNPYPSALDADAFIADNSTSTTGVLYFYDGTNDTSHSRASYTGGYATYNGVGTGFAGGTAPKRFIPIGQGFFVTRDGQASSTITFRNSQRAFVTRAGNSDFFAKGMSQKNNKNTSTLPVLRLRFGIDVTEDKRYERQLAISFSKDGTLGYNQGKDAEMFDRQPSDLGLAVERKNDIPYVISDVGYFDEFMDLPLLLYLDKDRKVTFTKDVFENYNASVYIYDAIEGKTHEITNNPIELSLEAGTYKNRFSVIFQNRSALHTEGELILEGFDIRFDAKQQKINITSKQNELRKVGLYNMLGQELKLMDKLNTGSFTLKTSHLETAIYIVKVKTDKGEFSKKIVINK